MDTKNPGIAALLSFFWPGMGQIYNGDTSGGIVWSLVTLVLYLLVICTGGLFLIFLIPVCIVSIISAKNQAEQINKEQHKCIACRMPIDNRATLCPYCRSENVEIFS